MGVAKAHRVLNRIKNEAGDYDILFSINTADDVYVDLENNVTLREHLKKLGQGTIIEDKTGIVYLPIDFQDPGMILYTNTAKDIGLDLKGVPGEEKCISLYLRGNTARVEHVSYYKDRVFIRHGIDEKWEEWYEHLTDGMHIAEIDYPIETINVESNPYVLSVNGYTPVNGNVTVPFDKLYVKRVEGKGLSTNDFTNDLLSKLENINISGGGGSSGSGDITYVLNEELYQKVLNIEEGAQVNVQPDWDCCDPELDTYILNKPSALPADGGDADCAFCITDPKDPSRKVYIRFNDSTGKIELVAEINGKESDFTLGPGTSYATIDYVNEKIINVYRFKGSVPNKTDLPANAEVGDVYDVIGEDSMNYAWNGTEWDSLGFNISLSNYYTKTEIDTKTQDINNKINDIENGNGTVQNAVNAENAKTAETAETAKNAETVNGKTVETSVPPNAVFTDTTYEPATSTSDGLMTAADKEQVDKIGDLNTLTTTDSTSIVNAINELKADLGNSKELAQQVLSELE